MEIQKKKKSTSKKLAKHMGKGTLGQGLAMMNPYLLSILDPFTYRGCKIPDDVTTHSCPFSVTQRATITVDGFGTCGYVLGQFPYSTLHTQPFSFLGSMVPGNWNDVAPFIIGGPTVFTSSVFSLANNTTVLSQWNNVQTTIQNVFTNVRLVSAGLRLSYTGTVLNAQGTITCWSNPRETIGNNNAVALGGSSIAFLQQLENSQVYSVPKYGGATVVYLPQDPISRQYGPTLSLQQYISESSTKYFGGELGVVVTGAVPSQTFLVEYVLNYEGEPYLNTFSLTQASPSKSDPIALAHATNVVSDAIPAQPLTKAEASKVEPVADGIKHHTSSKEPTMMDNILGTIADVGKGIGSVMNVAKDVGPVLSTVMSML